MPLLPVLSRSCMEHLRARFQAHGHEPKALVVGCVVLRFGAVLFSYSYSYSGVVINSYSYRSGFAHRLPDQRW